MIDSVNKTFLITKEYRKFAEFCDACRTYKYIGLCYGSPGVGKTLSAIFYSQWENMQYYESMYYTSEKLIWHDVKDNHTIFFTPHVATAPSILKKQIVDQLSTFNRIVDRAKAETGFYHNNPDPKYKRRGDNDFCQLLIIDEADRLNQIGLELVRDIYDTYQLGLILIGMLGIEKKFSRYGQFYSRVGFVHNYKTITTEEFEHILHCKWRELGLSFDPADFSDKEALNEIMRVTRGNFRLLNRLFTQLDRIMKINNINFISKEVVEAARENLIIGSQ